MAEYIDRETAIESLPVAWDSAVNALRNLPAADVAPVVYCRECEYHHWEQEPCHGRTEHYCSLIHGLTTVHRDTFCSYGVRKDENKA